MKRLIPVTLAILLLAGSMSTCTSPRKSRVAVVYPTRAEALEEFSARELQRYIYLRTGMLADLIPADRPPSGYKHCFVTGNRGRELLRDLPDSVPEMGQDDFTLKTVESPEGKRHYIAGGSGTGTLYGAYRMLENMGIRFQIDGDALPDELYDLDQLTVDESGKPLFAERGLQPFHDFSVGPDWWNEIDYQAVLAQMAKMRLNFIGFHTYPSWNPAAGPEANVWIGLPGDVDEDGNVLSGYTAGVVTTRKGWEVKPFPARDYASGGGLLFEGDDYGPDFMLECLDWPKNGQDAVAMFNRYGNLQQKVFENSQRLGIHIATGPELPVGIPPMLADRLKGKGLDPDDPEVRRQLYEGMFLRLMRKTPVDVVWFWLPEIWLWSQPGCPGWEITTEANVKRDIGLITEAAKETGVPFSFATSGWRLGTVNDPFWTDRNTPEEWAISSINTSAGNDPVEKAYGEITGRPKWVIGWAEDDGAAGAHCCTTWDLQLWVQRMFDNSNDARRYGCEGMMAIHWRTASIAPNLAALSRAGWRFGKPGVATSNEGMDTDPDHFWADWGRGMFGGGAGEKAGRILQRLDATHNRINGLINNGYKTTDEEISALFAPVRLFDSLQPEIEGAGNRSRFDYWSKYLHATQLRVTTWVISSRLDLLMQQADSLQPAEEKVRFIRNEALPLRIDLARSWERMIAAFVDCAKSPGEVGTISSIEYGNRKRIVNAHDSVMVAVLGEPLPGEASIRTAYSGPDRIFVSSDCTRWKKGEPMEIRPFVLSDKPCSGVTFYWRPLGSGSFRKVPATYRARNAYRVEVPESGADCVEYYLEARIQGGKKVLYPATAPELNSTVVFW